MVTLDQPIYQSLFIFFLYISWVLYIFSLVISFNPTYNWIRNWLQQFISIYVSLLLIIKYNPYFNTSKIFTSFDKILVYNAGLFIFFTTVINKILSKYLQYIKADIKANYLYGYFFKDLKLGY